MAWPFGRSLASDQRRRAVQAYIEDGSSEPVEEDVQWLASVATAGDIDRARWELRYARRSLALLVAERDALDDRTASDVTKEMRQALQLDRSVAAGMVRVAERQLNERLTAYRLAMSMRSAAESVDVRVARVLLGVGPRRELSPDQARAAMIARGYLSASQDALRRAFGVASIPEDRPPG